MRCPSCYAPDTKVIDTRPAEDDASVRRRRECIRCSHRFTTYEKTEGIILVVKKTDGSTQVYDREKLLRGIYISCAKRPVSHEQINELAEKLERDLKKQQLSEITSKELGGYACRLLKELDEVAFVRFSSVYQDFQSVEEFSDALDALN